MSDEKQLLEVISAYLVKHNSGSALKGGALSALSIALFTVSAHVPDAWEAWVQMPLYITFLLGLCRSAVSLLIR